MLIPYDDKMVLADIENNTIVEIIKHVYRDYYEIPDIHQVKDDCLEFMFDNSRNLVRYRGSQMSMHYAVDIMEDILCFEGFIYKKDGNIINPRQLEMFPDLFKGDELIEE